MDISRFKDEAEYLARMKTPGALLNPRVDSTFKALFTQPTAASKAALHAFLEAAIERRITSVQLTANDAPAEFVGQRGVSYDIICTFDDGPSANVENIEDAGVQSEVRLREAGRVSGLKA